MQPRTDAGQVRGARWKRWVLCPLIALAGCGGDHHAGKPPTTDPHDPDKPAKTLYSVVKLSQNTVSLTPDINAKGQVAFTEDIGNVQVARLYDGKTILNLGTLGGARAQTAALNDLGQVAGSSNFSLASDAFRPFRWTESTGMVDLNASSPSFATARAADINNQGQVAGYAPFIGPVLEPIHAFRWSPQTGKLDLGTLNGPSSATAINDAGQVAGDTKSASGNALAFRWTETGGMVGLGTLGGAESRAVAINALGQVAGNSSTPAGRSHAFLWSPGKGMVDLGALRTGGDSFPNALNDKGWVTGLVRTPSDVSRAFVWTKEGGMIDLGTFGGATAVGYDVNNLGQVVGVADGRDGKGRAFVWTRAEGLVDLNTRIAGAKHGLELTFALGISDNGSIVAGSNAGLVLLVPRTGGPCCDHEGDD